VTEGRTEGSVGSVSPLPVSLLRSLEYPLELLLLLLVTELEELTLSEDCDAVTSLSSGSSTTECYFVTVAG